MLGIATQSERFMALQKLLSHEDFMIRPQDVLPTTGMRFLHNVCLSNLSYIFLMKLFKWELCVIPVNGLASTENFLLQVMENYTVLKLLW